MALKCVYVKLCTYIVPHVVINLEISEPIILKSCTALRFFKRSLPLQRLRLLVPRADVLPGGRRAAVQAAGGQRQLQQAHPEDGHAAETQALHGQQRE